MKAVQEPLSRTTAPAVDLGHWSVKTSSDPGHAAGFRGMSSMKPTASVSMKRQYLNSVAVQMLSESEKINSETT